MVQYLPIEGLKYLYCLIYLKIFIYRILCYQNKNLPLFIGNCTGLNGLIGLHREVSIDCVLLLTTLADGRHKSPVAKGFEITCVV